MATGDKTDIASRIKALLPTSWFGATSPNIDALNQGFASVGAYVFWLLTFVKAQTRLSTASGIFLDILAFDFFGARVRRKAGQLDAYFAALIKKEVVRPRATRSAVQNAVADLTQQPVTIVETANPQDTGGWGYAFAYDAAGVWGDPTPYQFFLTVPNPSGSGIPLYGGMDAPQSGYGSGYFALADPSLTQGAVTQADIFASIEATRAAGVTAWVNIGNIPPVGGRLDIDFTLDQTLLG